MSWVMRYVALANKIPKPYIQSVIGSIYVKRISEVKLSQQVNRIALFKLSTPEAHAFRNKYTSKQKRPEEESDSDDDDNENEASLDDVKDRSSKIVNVHVNSLRADLIIKSGLGVARNKVEELFYSNRLRINGKKMFKKSMQLCVNDEVDVIHGVSPLNPDFLVVSRVKVLSTTTTEDKGIVKLQRFKSLVVENYEDPWKDAARS